ncbi:uncharacterized protein LOC107366827 [Tetranychus urticae]|uniref:uncharacterized protein LOC107366827 n=1 Tax=Tetranychus urticae TaxID=32264 RepID=UPI00077B8AB1|nr:uncharacterized protein LOC107366827 [Tetranychus urticae]
MTELWNIPDKGSFRNPYFAGRTNKKEVEPKDESDSVYEISTTDESDDSQPNNDAKVKSIKKRRPRRRKNTKQTAASLKTENNVKKTIKPDEDKKDVNKKDIIPGPEPSTVNTSDPIKDEKDVKISSDVKVLDPVKTSPMEIVENNEVKETQDISKNVDTCVEPIGSVNGKSDDKIEAKCIRIGCCNSPVAHTEWDNEYCSFKCVVEHCKIAFFNWTVARQAEEALLRAQAEEARLAAQAEEAQLALKG